MTKRSAGDSARLERGMVESGTALADGAAMGG
jgi:hypothetical protein